MHKSLLILFCVFGLLACTSHEKVMANTVTPVVDSMNHVTHAFDKVFYDDLKGLGLSYLLGLKPAHRQDPEAPNVTYGFTPDERRSLDRLKLDFALAWCQSQIHEIDIHLRLSDRVLMDASQIMTLHESQKRLENRLQRLERVEQDTHRRIKEAMKAYMGYMARWVRTDTEGLPESLKRIKQSMAAYKQRKPAISKRKHALRTRIAQNKRSH